MYAYNGLYINSATENLAAAFEFMIRGMEMTADQAEALFLMSEASRQFEAGNPAYVSGMSGIELAETIILDSEPGRDIPEYFPDDENSPEYWAGWALAQYQWFSGKTFRDIFQRIPLGQIIGMHKTYQGKNITGFFEAMETLYVKNRTIARLKQIREERGISQSELAARADINIRNIHMYEQKPFKIDNATIGILSRIAHVLNCSIEDLLEDPLREEE